MDPVLVAVGVGFLVLISVLGYFFGPGAMVVFWIILKTLIGYGWKFFAPLWVLLKSRNPYKVAAIVLTFGSFMLHFYSFLKVGDTSALVAATNALSATITGSLQEITTSVPVLTGSAGVKKKGLAFVFLFMAFARIYLYFVAWKMLKNRTPELAYYLLVFSTFFLLVWGSQDANALFEVFDVAQSVANQAATEANTEMLNNSLSGIAPDGP